MTQTTNLTTGKASDVFPGQYEGEEILIFIRRHWMAFVGWIALIVIMLSIPLIVLIAILSSQGTDFFRGTNLIYIALGTSVYLLVTNAVFLTAWIEHYLDVAIITPERLIHISQVGLFNRHVAELSLLRVQDVSASVKGYFQSVFHYGKVVVESAGDTPNFVMPFAPKPQLIANTILTLHDRLVSNRQVGKVDEIARRSRPVYEQASDGSMRPIRNELRRQVPSTAPPADYEHHPHFSQDLLSQKRDLDRRLKAEQAALPKAQAPVASSPNRLRTMASLDDVEDEEELEEGKSVRL